jgi:hypothetical protein
MVIAGALVCGLVYPSMAISTHAQPQDPAHAPFCVKCSIPSDNKITFKYPYCSTPWQPTRTQAKVTRLSVLTTHACFMSHDTSARRCHSFDMINSAHDISIPRPMTPHPHLSTTLLTLWRHTTTTTHHTCGPAGQAVFCCCQQNSLHLLKS